MKAIFVFAHPDDETFSSGGTIAKLTKRGVDVELITATRGEKGLVGDPPVCRKEELGKVREQELRKAAKILGISKIYFLDFIDNTLYKIPLAKIAVRILEILKKENPDVVVTFNEEGGSRHPDHIRISRAATSAFDQYLRIAKKRVKLYYTANPRSLIKKFEKMGLGYTAFGKIQGTPDKEITTIINISDTVKTKIKAGRQHRTQNKDFNRLLKRRRFIKIDKEYFKLIRENLLG